MDISPQNLHWSREGTEVDFGDGRRFVGLTLEEAILIAAVPRLLRLLAGMSERPNAPAKVDIDRCLQACEIEIIR